MDPLRNSTLCLICMTPYHLAQLPTLEHIPGGYTFVYMFLRFPMLLCFVVNYGLLIQLSIFPKVDMFLYMELYQYLFQTLYFALLWRVWKVRNKAAYWLHWKHPSTTILLLTLIWSNAFLHHHYFVAIVPINFVLALTWQRHTQILQSINLEH